MREVDKGVYNVPSFVPTRVVTDQSRSGTSED